MASPPTIDGQPLISGSVREPLTGAWVADFVADYDQSIEGSVSMVIDDVSFTGTVRDPIVDNGKVSGRLVAGAGSLLSESDAGEVAAKNYTGVSLQTILDDIMRLSGESLASDSTSVSAYRVRNWQRSKGPYRRAVEALATKAGQNWRTLRDGTLWLGVDEWPAADETGIEEVSADAADAFFDLREAIAIKPGVTYQGKRIIQTTHYVDKGGTRTEAWVKSANGSLNQLKEQLRREADYDRLWACTVISQRSDYSLELLADDERIRGTGHDQVLIAPGLPGVRTEVPGGARCYIEFAGGDPALPRVTAWDAETTMTLLILGDASAAQFVALANLVDDRLSTHQSKYDSHTHGTGVGPTTVPTPLIGALASTAAAKVKAE